MKKMTNNCKFVFVTGGVMSGIDLYEYSHIG